MIHDEMEEPSPPGRCLMSVWAAFSFMCVCVCAFVTSAALRSNFYVISLELDSKDTGGQCVITGVMGVG